MGAAQATEGQSGLGRIGSMARMMSGAALDAAGGGPEKSFSGRFSSKLTAKAMEMEAKKAAGE